MAEIILEAEAGLGCHAVFLQDFNFSNVVCPVRGLCGR